MLLARSAAFLHRLHAGRVDAVRLFDEHMLAGLDRRQGVQRMELGGVGDQDDVRGLDDVLVGVEAGEAVVVIRHDLVGLSLLEESRGPP